MSATWRPGGPGVLELPGGRLVRGRSLRRPPPAGPGSRSCDLVPDLTLCLLARPPQPLAWESRWVRWPDLALPADGADAREALVHAWSRSAAERVEVGCDGGRGRTGTALACLAVLAGVPPEQAVAYVRRRYDPRAVETPWQRRFVRRFAA